MQGFPWDTVPDGGKVVDVGGNVGSVSLVVAKQYPKLKFVVQDLPHVVGHAATVGAPVRIVVGCWLIRSPSSGMRSFRVLSIPAELWYRVCTDSSSLRFSILTMDMRRA